MPVRRRKTSDVASGEKVGLASEPITYGVPGSAGPVAGPLVIGVSRKRIDVAHAGVGRGPMRSKERSAVRPEGIDAARALAHVQRVGQVLLVRPVGAGGEHVLVARLPGDRGVEQERAVVRPVGELDAPLRAKRI